MDSSYSAKQYGSRRLVDYTEGAVSGRGTLDIPFLLITLLLLIVGVIMVLSASFARAYYDFQGETGGNPTFWFSRQLVFAIAGLIAMYFISKIPISFFRRISFLVLIGSIALLALVPIIGVATNGAKRWISLGFTTFQPSEIAKIGVVLYFSALICKYKDRMKTFQFGVLPFVGILVIIIGLLLLEPHLSASLIIIAVGAILMFVGGARLYWFVGGLIVVLLGGVLAVSMFSHASTRISVWLDPMADTTGDGWQVIQSLYAVGSGGLMGLGLGQSRQKYLYLPEEHNDFIFAVVCEELGFIGAALILVLFALLVMRGYWLALHTKDRYSFLVCVGLTSLLAIQVLLNVAVVTNLVPCTGISLPFFSYGGTALLIQLAEMGVILSISRDIPGKKSG